MKKKIFAVLTAVFMVMALIPTLAFAADDAITLDVTFTNTGDGDLYVWYGGVNGDAAAKVDGGKVTLEVTSGSWGFVVVNMPSGTAFDGSDWDSKDYQTGDIKPNLADVANGETVEITIDLTNKENVSTDNGVEIKYPEAPATSDEEPATSEEESSTTEESSTVESTPVESTPAQSTTTTSTTTVPNAPTGVQGVTLAVVAVIGAGAIVAAKKSKK